MVLKHFEQLRTKAERECVCVYIYHCVFVHTNVYSTLLICFYPSTFLSSLLSLPHCLLLSIHLADYVYFENSSSNPYLVRRIEELNKVRAMLAVGDAGMGESRGACAEPTRNQEQVWCELSWAI